jgi:hypothetical protein
MVLGMAKLVPDDPSAIRVRLATVLFQILAVITLFFPLSLSLTWRRQCFKTFFFLNDAPVK